MTEKPRRGRPPKLDDAQRAKITALLKHPQISTADLAEEYGVSIWTIQRFLPPERRIKRGAERAVARDLTGEVFGKRTVLYKAARREPNRNIFWACRCACGRVDDVRGDYLVAGHSHQCPDCRVEESRGKPKTKRKFW